MNKLEKMSRAAEKLHGTHEILIGALFSHHRQSRWNEEGP